MSLTLKVLVNLGAAYVAIEANYSWLMVLLADHFGIILELRTLDRLAPDLNIIAIMVGADILSVLELI